MALQSFDEFQRQNYEKYLKAHEQHQQPVPQPVPQKPDHPIVQAKKSKGGEQDGYRTPLNYQEQQGFDHWARHNHVNPYDKTYDWQGYFKSTKGQHPAQKIPQFATPFDKHFTDQSIYSSNENPGGHFIKDKTGHQVYVPGDEWHKEQLNKVDKRKNPRISDQIPSFEQWAGKYDHTKEFFTYDLHNQYYKMLKSKGGDWKKDLHQYVSNEEHNKRMQQADKTKHHDSWLGKIGRHVDAVGLSMVEGLIGIPEFISDVAGKALGNNKAMQAVHDEFTKYKQTVEEKRVAETSDSKGTFRTLEDAVHSAAQMGTEMFVLGGLEGATEGLAKLGTNLLTKVPGKGKGVQLALKGLGKTLQTIAKVDNKFNLATNLGYFGTKSGMEYFRAHTDMIKDLETHGIPKDSTPEEQDYYESLLKNKKHILRNAFGVALVNGAAFSLFHGTDVFNKMITPMTNKFGGTAAREWIAKMWAEGAEKSGFKGFMQKRAAEAAQLGVDVALPAAQSSATFAGMGVIPGIAEKMIEKHSFNKDWTWKEVGGEALSSALTGFAMSAPHLVVGPSQTFKNIREWKNIDKPRAQLNEHFSKVDKIQGPEATIRAFQSETTLADLTNKLTKEQKIKAIEIAKEGKWTKLHNVTKDMKPEDAENFKKYVVETKTIDKLYNSKGFDKKLYDDFTQPLKQIRSSGGDSFDPTTRLADVVSELRTSEDPQKRGMVEKVVSTIDEREDVKPAVKDAVKSFILQNFSYGDEGMKKMNEYMNEHTDKFMEVLSGETEANQQRGKDFHALLSDIVKGKRSTELYDRQGTHTTEGVYDRIVEAIEKHGGLGTEADKKALILAGVEDMVAQMNNHYKQCLDMTSNAGMQKVIDFFKKHHNEYVDTENSFNYFKLKHFMGEEGYEQLMKDIEGSGSGLDEELPDIPQESPTNLESAQTEELPAGIEKEPEQDGDVLPQTSESEEQLGEEPQDPTPDEIEQHVRDTISAELDSTKTPFFEGLSDTAYAEYISGIVREYADSREGAEFYLKHSSGLERLSYKMANDPDAETYDAHYENKRLGLEYSVVYDKASGTFEVLSEGESLGTAQTFNEASDLVFGYLEGIEKERGKLPLQGRNREPKPEPTGEAPTHQVVEDFQGEKATVVSRAPKIPRLEREHKRANSPTYPNEHFQKGELTLSDNWREVTDMNGNIHGEHFAIMEDTEQLLKSIFDIPSLADRRQAIDELKSNKPLWDKVVDILPLRYKCEAGNYFIHDDFMGAADKDSPMWNSYREMREKMIENIILNKGKLGDIKVKRIFGNIDKGAIRSITGTEMSKVGKISMKDGNLIIEHNGAKLALSSKVLGHNYNIEGNDVDISQELANLIANTGYNGGKLTITPETAKDYGIKVDENVDARKIIELFYNSKIDAADGRSGYVHVDYDNKKMYVNNKEEGGLYQTSRTFNEEDMLKRTAELQSVLALRPIDIDPNKLNNTIPFNLEIGDFKAQKGQTLKEALLENGFLLSNNDIDQPYRDTSLQITYDPGDTQPSVQQSYEEMIAKPGKMEPKLTAKGAETTGLSNEEKYIQKKIEKLQKVDIPSDLVFRESSVYENTRFVRPEPLEEREKVLTKYREMLSEKTGGTLTITNDNRTPLRVAIEKSVEGWKPETKGIVDLFEESGAPHYFHACMSVDGATLHNRSISNSLYHEAFHRVSLLYLNPEERAGIYDEARRSFAQCYGMDDAKVEEFLAEKFRTDVASSDANIIKEGDNRVMKALRSMWEFVKQYVMNIRPEVSGIEGLMDNIANGKYKYVRPNSESIREFKALHPNNYVGFESNGTVFPSIPNKQTYDNIVKTMANRVLEVGGSDIGSATNAEEFIATGLENTFNKEIEEYKNNPMDDSERAIAYREDLLHPEAKDTFVKDIVNYIKTKGGLKRYLDSFHSDDDTGATLRYAFDADKTDPYARCNDRLYNVINNLKGDYDPELTMNKYHGAPEVRSQLMKRFGGNFSTMEELKSVMAKEANDPKAPAIFKSFHDAIINDPELLNSAYTMFNVEKVNYKDIHINNGNVRMVDSKSTGTRRAIDQWTDRLADMRNMDKDYIKTASMDMTKMRDIFTKGIDAISYGDYINGIVEGVSRMGMDVDKDALHAAARDFGEMAYGDEPGWANMTEEEKQPFYKEALSNTLSAGGRGNLFNEMQRIWQTAKKGFGHSYSRLYGEKVLVPFENIIKGDSPAFNALAEIMSKYGNDYSTSFVNGPDGKARYLHRDPSYFGELGKFFNNPEVIQNLMNDERLSANSTLHQGRVSQLRFSEALAFKGDGKTVDYSQLSPLESFQMRLQSLGMRQISDKGRMPIIEGIIDNYQGPDDLLQTHGLAEYNTRLTAQSVRAGFVRDMLGLTKGIVEPKDIEDFNNLGGQHQRELLKEKRLLDYGMVEGYHYKYVKETDSNGKLTGWKIQLDGGGYKPRFFGHIDEASKPSDRFHLSDTSEDLKSLARKVVTDPDVLAANSKHLDEYLQLQLDKAAEVGAFPKTTLAELNPENIPQAKLDEWNASFTSMCDRLADSTDPRLQEFKEQFGIQTGEDIQELINNEGSDILIPISGKQLPLKKLGLEGVGKFFKEYGDSPYAEIEQKQQQLDAIKEQVYSALVRDLEINELIEGDPAFSGGYNNQTKRISGMFSTGKKFVSDFPEGHPLAGRTKFKRINVHDAIVHNEGDWEASAKRRAKSLMELHPGEKAYEAWLEQAREETKGVRDVMSTDGQSFVSPSMAREMQIRLGLWNEEKQAAYEDLKAFINGSDKEMRGKTVVSPVMKCMHWEQKAVDQLMHDGTSKMLTGYEFHKTAYAPLLVYDREHPMFKVLKHMEDNDIGVMGFGSTTKTFGTDKVQLWDGDGNLMEENLKGTDKYVTEHSWDNLRWQLPTDPHGNKNRKIGIQSMKILFDVADKATQNKMHDAISKIANMKIRGAFEDQNNSDLSRKIVSRGIGTGVQDNSVEAITQGVNIAKLRNPQITKSALQGISKSLETTMNGGSLIQVSNIGRSNLRMADEKGRTEVAVNMGAIRQYLPKGASLEDAKMILDKINKECGGSELLLYRVPTQGATSMLHGVIKEVLPDSAGEVIYHPDGVCARLGSDFDVDKLYYASKTLVPRGNDKFKPNEDLLAEFEEHINSSKIVDDADEKGVGRIKDRMDFDYIQEAHKFALDNHAIYDEATDTFKTIKGGKKAYFENIRYEALSNENGESSAGYGNAYLDAAYAALHGNGADLPATSSVDGPVSHAKTLLSKISPTTDKVGLHQLGVAAQVDNRANNLGGQENIGPYALASSMKAIYENGKQGSIIPKSDRPVNLKFGNVTLDIPDFITRNDRGTIFNKQGRTINDDLMAYVSLSVDSSKDPIMLSGNNNNLTNRACALLLLEGHGDAAPALISNPIVRDFVNMVESGKTGNPMDHYLEAIQKYSTIGDIIPDKYENNKLFRDKFAEYYSKKIDALGDKVMDPDWLIKQNERYKEYLNEGIPVEEWPESFRDNQVAIFMQFMNANAKAYELGQRLAINQIDKKFGGDYAEFYTTMTKMSKAKMTGEEFFNPAKALADLNNSKEKGYHIEKAKNAMEAILKLKDAGMVDFSEPFMNTYHNIVNNHMKSFANRRQSMNNLHDSMMRSSYAMAFEASGIDTKSLYQGENTVWDQFWNLNKDGLLDPSNPVVKYLLKSTSTGLEKTGSKVLKIDLHEIEGREDQANMIQGFRDLKSFANDPRIDKFINDYITYSYISGGSHVAPHLFPPEMIEAHEGIQNALGYLNVLDDYDLANNALRHATLDKYGAMGDAEFSFSGDKLYAKGINMDKSHVDPEMGVVAFNLKPSARKPKNFIVANMPDGDKRVFRLVYSHEGEVTDKGETKYTHTYAIAPLVGERMKEGYIAGTVDEGNDRKVVKAALKRLYGNDVPEYARVHSDLLSGDDSFDPFADKVLWNESPKPNIETNVTEAPAPQEEAASSSEPKNDEFTVIKDRQITITNEPRQDTEGVSVVNEKFLKDAVEYAKSLGGSLEDFKNTVRDMLDTSNEVVLPEYAEIDDKYVKPLADILDQYGVDIVHDGETCFFQVGKVRNANDGKFTGLSEQHLGILSEGAKELKRMGWEDFNTIDNGFTNIVSKEDFERAHKNGLIDVIATFAANDGYSAANVAEASGIDAKAITDKIMGLKDDPLVLKLINKHYDEPMSSKLFNSLPEPAQKSIIESMVYC